LSERHLLLIVDDDSDIREMMALCLERVGYQVEGVSSGQQALRRLAEAPIPALVLLDLMMPSMSGQQLWQALRALPGLKDVVVVAVSGDHAVREKAEAMGLRGHLKKPFALHDLLITVRRALEPGGGSGAGPGGGRPHLGPGPVRGPDGTQSAARSS
jgi:CheY-like chemotaxis protein